MMVSGINNVLEALESAVSKVESVMMAKGRHNPRLKKIITLCHKKSVPLLFREVKTLDQLTGDSRHQYVTAQISALPHLTLDKVLEDLPRLILLADSIEDPRNLGALIRTADATGVSAILLPERRSCPLTNTVVQASAGAAFHLPVVRVGNSGQLLDRLRAKGYWTAGLDMSGPLTPEQIDISLPLVVCVGGEHQGLRQVIRKRCDFLVSLPMSGKVSSLNLSVAAGVLLYHIMFSRQNRGSIAEQR